jgi:hypothetical protein
MTRAPVGETLAPPAAPDNLLLTDTLNDHPSKPPNDPHPSSHPPIPGLETHPLVAKHDHTNPLQTFSRSFLHRPLPRHICPHDHSWQR